MLIRLRISITIKMPGILEYYTHYFSLLISQDSGLLLEKKFFFENYNVVVSEIGEMRYSRSAVGDQGKIRNFE